MNANDSDTRTNGWAGPAGTPRARIFLAGMCFGIAIGIAVGMLLF